MKLSRDPEDWYIAGCLAWETVALPALLYGAVSADMRVFFVGFAAACGLATWAFFPHVAFWVARRWR